jgi:hypothetical protein
MKTIIMFLWRNKGAIFTGISLAWEYAPKVKEYLKQKFKKQDEIRD